MRRFLFIVFVSLVSSGAGFSQTGNWTWIKGDSTVEAPSIYGIERVSSAANTPGARESSTGSAEKSGNLWLFGGHQISFSSSGSLNDLWKYNVTTNEWTWLKGDTVSDAGGIYGTKGSENLSNKPGARARPVSWLDNSGNFWLFGGDTYDNGDIDFNDLWKYNKVSNQWAWVNGDSVKNIAGFYGSKGTGSIFNKPGARSRSVSWTDKAGSLWLFGGTARHLSGVPGHHFNDLWRYDPSSNIWTWVSGDSTANVEGIYGTQGIASINNKPGARDGSVSWIDSAGNFWLFGGTGYTAGGEGLLNDLWKYNPLTNEWTWVKGSSSFNASASYGTQGIASPTNTPKASDGSTGWIDSLQNLYLFGGTGNVPGNQDVYNELWRFNTATNNWTWIKGDAIPNGRGRYGMQGTSSPTAKPGARERLVGWAGLNTGYIFGGYGYSSPYHGILNDVWKFEPFNTLPVHLLTFTALLQQDKVNLNWKVENEQNFDRYEVERSPNGLEFVKIQNVKCKIESGSKHEYNTIDDVSQLTTHNSLYYRLKLLDKDGKFSYSNIEKVRLPKEDPLFTLYPNPAVSNVQLQLNKTINGTVTVEVVDVAGKIVISKSYNVAGNNITVSTQKLPQGDYNVRLLYNNEQYVQKLVVVK